MFVAKTLALLQSAGGKKNNDSQHGENTITCKVFII